MSDTTLHIRIKKNYAAALIKVYAVEAVEEGEAIELTAQQKEALDKELAAIASNPAYLQKWDDIIDTMLTKKKSKDFFQKNIAAL